MPDNLPLKTLADSFYGAILNTVRGCAEIRAILQGLPTSRDSALSLDNLNRYDRWIELFQTLPHMCPRLIELFQTLPVSLDRAKETFTDRVRQQASGAHPSGAVKLQGITRNNYGEIAIMVVEKELEGAPLPHLVDMLDPQGVLLEQVCSHLKCSPFFLKARAPSTDQVEALAEPYQELVQALERESRHELRELTEQTPDLAGRVPADGSADRELETPQYVTLNQVAVVVHRSKRTLEKYKTRKNNPLPVPDVEGGGGKPDEWLWDSIRPWLEIEFRRTLPQQYPTMRQS